MIQFLYKIVTLLWPRNEISIKPIETTKFTKIQEGVTNQIVNNKTMLIYFFDMNGIMNKQFIPPGQVMNQHFYLELLSKLWTCREDNQKCGVAVKGFFMTMLLPMCYPNIQQFLAKNNLINVSQAPDLMPCDIFVFSYDLKWECFANINQVKQKTLEALNKIHTEEFQKYFQ